MVRVGREANEVQCGRPRLVLGLAGSSCGVRGIAPKIRFEKSEVASVGKCLKGNLL